jgi:hypothetical protein
MFIGADEKFSTAGLVIACRYPEDFIKFMRENSMEGNVLEGLVRAPLKALDALISASLCRRADCNLKLVPRPSLLGMSYSF